MGKLHFGLRAWACIGCLLTAAPAWSLDLVAAYRMAVQADATYLAAKASAEASREAIPQARAGLLPVVSISSSRSRNDTHQESMSAFGPIENDYKNYPAKSDTLGLRQPIFRMPNIIAYGQAQAQVEAAEAILRNETQNMAIRVSTAYFDALLAQEQLAAVRSQKSAYAAQLALSQRAFKAGEGTRTDIDEANARLLTVTAQEIEAMSMLEKAERVLAAVINQRVPASALAGLDSARLETGRKNRPADLEALIAQAEESNHELLALRHQVEAASKEVSKTRAQHLPTLDLVVSRSQTQSDTSNTIGSSYRSTSVGVQLNLPLFSGGSMVSATRQALANEERLRQQLEAAQQVVASTRKGVQAGTRNTVDILNAEQQLASARGDLARAQRDYVLARLRLKAYLGALGEEDVEEANRWLRPM